MDILKMLVEMRTERENLEEAIVTLERLARGQGKRRGRPPLWMQKARKGPGRVGRPPKTEAKSA
jgi:DNA invertase Pin-like site-specific DNA recombinase